MHKVQWVPGMRISTAPQGWERDGSDHPMGAQEVSRDEGTGSIEGIQVDGDVSIQAKEAEWWSSTSGVYDNKHQ